LAILRGEDQRCAATIFLMAESMRAERFFGALPVNCQRRPHRNPNAEKTTLCQCVLNGLRARYELFPGVTLSAERRPADRRTRRASIKVARLPGTYSLKPAVRPLFDEQIARCPLIAFPKFWPRRTDVLVVVVDGLSNLPAQPLLRERSSKSGYRTISCLYEHDLRCERVENGNERFD